MNQVQVLLNHLTLIKDFRDKSRNITASAAWAEVTEIGDVILLHARMNELESIALKLYSQLIVENEIYGNDPNEDWIREILQGLSLKGDLHTNIDSIHKHTYTLLKSHVRNWNHGYTVHSTLDDNKINQLLSKLKDERESIFVDKTISNDLKRVLIIEIDKLIYSLENYQTLGEDLTKEAITKFYSEAIFNKDIQKYYHKSSNFKEVIDQVCAAITLGTFTSPVFSSLLDVAQSTVQSLP
ncbi:hypothetical protein [Acinetobacter radioresistens]|uniref:hypothetical protein n=1 Tax=Acinetobacter radioresistens TaxID=40216 RepID=UPI002247E7C3|nr:hypothetical protein [Acinetobacter radioresistens]MCX0334773.1 hypothetical protein [Acinetobacter radioresistens]